MLDESAEIQRVSRDALDRPEIFLARRQPLPWGGSGLSPGDSGYSADDGTVPTPWKDSLFLFLMGAAPCWSRAASSSAGWKGPDDVCGLRGLASGFSAAKRKIRRARPGNGSGP